MEKILNYIDGAFEAPCSDQYLDNYDPSIGKVYSLIPDSDERDVNKAVDAATRAFPAWSTLPAQERSNILQKLADLIDRDLDKLALAESVDNGKPVSLARRLDIPRASANIRFFATAILHTSTETHITDAEAINYTTHAPIGVAGCISPWNLPLYLFSWKIAPALAAGCTVVGKPSELTPMTAFLFSKLCVEAGLPKGVLNIVHGLGAKAGQAIAEHPGVAAISFTGGTVTGKKIAATAAPMFKKLSLELGGKNPNIIFADCDFENAVATSIQSSFANQGEICLCGSRIFVERPLYEKFVEAFVKKTKALVLGDPLLNETNLGALVSAAHKQKVMSYIQTAKQEGGKILTGGNAVNPTGRCAEGYFIEPTIITGLNEHCRTNQEEIFGPVVTIMPFDTEAEAIALANSTPYGLSATLWTENLKRAHRVSAAVKSGILWVNCWLFRDLRTPFGGMKQSGVGREGGWHALKFFLEVKNICIKL
ncbi:aminomuconate-semialdehyde/2-hydroxymuconate-6-semialdehyde dehydrogenase [Chryseolinea serpens]|uniref:Aminomuconate-semialdehyde/2-hydroxymuconate-6-semialdehyde dehydrogenase n=1 Tax=Chryseolinea serpens TaxID=947013 RepID=A0A1M5WEX1_9BACT|nr:aldehyde dehydrogenase [Chryseolinea serpens]SHH85977.1 aminomuconate-semialdehyde/2-hydroxymuconate-6-semialdehyde dehydrogenase [Chryseolinea serpens]